MRKFMKGCAITALIFILLGLILGVSGSLGNGSTHFSPGEILSAVTLGRISGEKVDDWSDGVTEQIRENMDDVHYDLEDNVDYDSDYEVKSGKIELYVLGDDSQGITDLRVQAGGCVMKIQVSEDDCFRVEADGMRKFHMWKAVRWRSAALRKQTATVMATWAVPSACMCRRDIILKIPLWIWEPEASV